MIVIFMVVVVFRLASMVAIAQLVEPRVVISVVEGSSPFSHPIYSLYRLKLISKSVGEKLMGFFCIFLLVHITYYKPRKLLVDSFSPQRYIGTTERSYYSCTQT